MDWVQPPFDPEQYEAEAALAWLASLSDRLAVIYANWDFDWNAYYEEINSSVHDANLFRCGQRWIVVANVRGIGPTAMRKKTASGHEYLVNVDYSGLERRIAAQMGMGDAKIEE